MKKFRTLVSALLVLAFVLAAIPAFAAGKDANVAPADVSGNTFTNEYITFTINNYAHFYEYMTVENGNAADDLLYPHYGSYGSSFTTVRVNGSSYEYGSNTSYMTVAPAFQGNTNYSAGVYNDVLVEQRLTPVLNDLGHESIVEWHYTYTNNSSSDKTVGLRIMLDTCLGTTAGDGAPYRVPGQDSITTEQMYTGENIPPYWFTYYQDIVAQGTFDADNMPSQFQISQWGRIHNTMWGYENTYSGTMSDTACAATWYEETLAPGETREYVMYYGLGELQQEQNGELQLTLNGNHSVAVNAEGNGYEPNPISIVNILANVGNGTLNNAYVSYVESELPAGLSFAQPTTTGYNRPVFVAGDEYQFTCYINIDSTSTEDRTFLIPVHYGCDEQEDAVVYFELFVPGIPAEETVPPTVEGLRAELRNRAFDDSKVDLRFVYQVNFNDGFVNYGGVTYGPGTAYGITRFYSVLTANGRGVTIAGNNIYQMYNDNYTYTAVLRNMRPANYASVVTGIGYIEYVEVATGAYGEDNSADTPLAYCVNDLLVDDVFVVPGK